MSTGQDQQTGLSRDYPAAAVRVRFRLILGLVFLGAGLLVGLGCWFKALASRIP